MSCIANILFISKFLYCILMHSFRLVHNFLVHHCDKHAAHFSKIHPRSLNYPFLIAQRLLCVKQFGVVNIETHIYESPSVLGRQLIVLHRQKTVEIWYFNRIFPRFRSEFFRLDTDICQHLV